MDKIMVGGIELYAYGGVTAAERALGQRYRVDVDLFLDLENPGASDDLRDTVHYGEVAHSVTRAMRDRPFNLIEHAATRVASAVLAEYPVEAVTVRVAKLLPPIDGIVASASVEISRTR